VAGRIGSRAFASKVMSAEDAAALIPASATVGMSGFTGAGYPKEVPGALARRIAEAAQRGTGSVSACGPGDPGGQLVAARRAGPPRWDATLGVPTAAGFRLTSSRGQSIGHTVPCRRPFGPSAVAIRPEAGTQPPTVRYPMRRTVAPARVEPAVLAVAVLPGLAAVRERTRHVCGGLGPPVHAQFAQQRRHLVLDGLLR
jgi:Acetyl-CoA hydrolase/transferase N-terminal domain